MNLNRLGFYLTRLKNASGPELRYRLKESLFIKRLKFFPTTFKKSRLVPSIDPIYFASLTYPSLLGRLEHTTLQKILKGELFSLGCNFDLIRKFEDTERKKFFTDVTTTADPDIRAVWEPARLQHLTILLHHIREIPAAEEADQWKSFTAKALLDWIYNNPFPNGPHYMSVMECGLRIPVFFFGLKVLDNLEENERRILLQAIFDHAWLTRRRLSLYSSLGNHTVAESLGLVIAGAIFRQTAQGQDWLKTGLRLLETECRHQINDDGGPAEQSLNYHRFVLDLYWLALAFLEQNNIHNCTAMKERLERGERFWTAFLISGEKVPSIGDSDDGYAVAPGLHPHRGESYSKPLSGPKIKDTLQTFPFTGYSVFRTTNRLVLTFDHGPLGMPPLYNHGHADALSVTLSSEAGQELLVDPGTYRYNGVPEWRKYFKGTTAHNTVTVDDSDQAPQLTGFIWGRGYETVLVPSMQTGDTLALTAVHNGYAQGKTPVWHRRTVALRPDVGFIIQDTFSGIGDHKFRLHYHLSPGTIANPAGNSWLIDNDGTEVIITLLKGGPMKLIKGSKDPLLGWSSSGYGSLSETSTLCAEIKGQPAETAFVTVIGDSVPLERDQILETMALYG